VVRVALTGGIASGKSHVLAAFAARDVPTIDADLLAHAVVAAGTPAAQAIERRFGHEIVGDDGEINRRKLGAVVFSDAGARRDLEAIVHPAVYSAIRRWFEMLPANTPLAVADIPLLYETGHDSDFDVVVVAACEPEEQIRRVMTRDDLTEPEARSRVAAQLPIGEKISRADYVVWTTGTQEATSKRVGEVAEELRSSFLR
jgi:dephospho-CoA kinase